MFDTWEKKHACVHVLGARVVSNANIVVMYRERPCECAEWPGQCLSTHACVGKRAWGDLERGEVTRAGVMEARLVRSERDIHLVGWLVAARGVVS